MVPETIGNIKSLKDLDLEYNNLISIPELINMVFKNEERIRGEQVFFFLRREGRKREAKQRNSQNIHKASRKLYHLIYFKNFNGLSKLFPICNIINIIRKTDTTSQKGGKGYQYQITEETHKKLKSFLKMLIEGLGFKDMLIENIMEFDKH